MSDAVDKTPQVAVAVLERADKVLPGAKLPTCVAGPSYNVPGLAVHAVAGLPDSWDVVGRRYPVVTKLLQPGGKVRALKTNVHSYLRQYCSNVGPASAAHKIAFQRTASVYHAYSSQNDVRSIESRRVMCRALTHNVFVFIFSWPRAQKR